MYLVGFYHDAIEMRADNNSACVKAYLGKINNENRQICLTLYHLEKLAKWELELD